MALQWNPNTQDYEDVPGYGYATTPALRKETVSDYDFMRGWQEKLLPLLDSIGAWQQKYPGVQDQAGYNSYLDELENFRRAAFQRDLDRRMMGNNWDMAQVQRRNATNFFESGLANARQGRAMAALDEQQKGLDAEAQKAKMATMAYQADPLNNPNPTAQQATSFAPNVRGSQMAGQYVDPFLQQQIMPGGAVQWAERSLGPAQATASRVPSPENPHGLWARRGDQLNPTGIPVNFKGGEQLELINRSGANQSWISPEQLLSVMKDNPNITMPQAWQVSKDRPMPEQMQGSVFDPAQQSLMLQHLQKWAEDMSAAESQKGEKAPRQIKLPADWSLTIPQNIKEQLGMTGIAQLQNLLEQGKLSEVAPQMREVLLKAKIISPEDLASILPSVSRARPKVMAWNEEPAQRTATSPQERQYDQANILGDYPWPTPDDLQSALGLLKPAVQRIGSALNVPIAPNKPVWQGKISSSETDALSRLLAQLFNPQAAYSWYYGK